MHPFSSAVSGSQIGNAFAALPVTHNRNFKFHYLAVHDFSDDIDEHYSNLYSYYATQLNSDELEIVELRLFTLDILFFGVIM